MAIAREDTVLDWTQLSAKEIVARIEAKKRENAARGMPPPGSAKALLDLMDNGPWLQFEPGEYERLLDEVYRLRHEEI